MTLISSFRRAAVSPAETVLPSQPPPDVTERPGTFDAPTGEIPRAPQTPRSREEELALAAADYGGHIALPEVAEVPLYRDTIFVDGLRKAIVSRLERGQTQPVGAFTLRALAVGMRFRPLHRLAVPHADRLLTDMVLYDSQQQRASVPQRPDGEAEALRRLSQPPQISSLHLLEKIGAQPPTQEYADRVTATLLFRRRMSDVHAAADIAALEAHMAALGIHIPPPKK